MALYVLGALVNLGPEAFDRAYVVLAIDEASFMIDLAAIDV